MKILQKIGWATFLLGILLPGISFAQQCCPETNQILRDIKTETTGSGDYLYNLWNYQRDDLSQRQATTALINFQAAENIKKYNLDQQLLYMTAPGTDWALAAGVVVGSSNSSQKALQIATISIVGFYGLMSGADKIDIFGTTIDLSKISQDTDALMIFDKMKEFFTQGKTANIAAINPAGLLHNTNLKAANLTDADAQQLITVLTNPYPGVNQVLRAKLKIGLETLDGVEREELANKMVSGAIMGLSSSAFADIVARRTPATEGGKSVMDVMDEYSKLRFVNPDWYKTVGSASEASLLREIAHMQAYSIWVQYQQFKVAEQQMALLGSMNSVLAKTDVLLNQIMNEYRLAKQQAATYQSQSQEQLKKIELPKSP